MTYTSDTNLNQNGKVVRLDNSLPFNKDARGYLSDRGIPLTVAKKAGYRSICSKEGKDKINQSIGGLLIPFYDIEGNLVSHRLRPFKINWDSSPELKDYYLESKGELPKFLSRSKTSDDPRVNKAYFPPVLDWHEIKRSKKHDVVITEGEVKALSACLHDIPTIALSGVNCFINKVTLDPKNSDEVEQENSEAVKKEETGKEFLPELEWQTEVTNPNTGEKETISKWQGRSVPLIFDSDIVQKEPVKQALISLAIELKKRGANPFLVLLPTEADGSKNGLDDFIVKHGADALKRLIQQFKVLSKKPKKAPLNVWKEKDKETKTETFKAFIGDLEPIESIKGLMTWTCLKDNFKYRTGFGWYEWKGKNWELLPDESRILGVIRKFHYENHWLTKKDKSCLEDLRNLLTEETIEFDPPNILGFNNGYLNTDTNELLAHDKSLFVTSILPFDYNPLSQCPTWLNFLNYALKGDQNKITSLRAWIKWILMPKANRKFPIESTLWLVGKQGTGKGTFLDILVNLVGESNCGSLDPNALNNPNMLFGLAGKKLSLNSDVSGFITDIGNYNKICSNEIVPIKNLYHNCSQKRLNTVTVLAMNECLGFSGKSADGLKRRLHVVEFDNPPNEDQRDPELSEKLEKELSGIFAWAWELSMTQVKKILRWRSSETIEEIYNAQLSEIQFLADKYPDGTKQITASVLYQEYQEWCKESGFKALNKTNFGLQVKKVKGVDKCRKDKGIYYDIPPMKHYHDNDFGIGTPTPMSILNQKDEAKTEENITNENHQNGNNNQYKEIIDSTALTSNNNHQNGNNNQSSKIIDSTAKTSNNHQSNNNQNGNNNQSSKIIDSTALNPTENHQNSNNDSTAKTPNNNHENGQNNSTDEDLIYEDFKTVSTVQSLDLRALKNQAEKIRRAILDCSDKTELDQLRQDNFYSNDEINWVWDNLLSPSEKERMAEISKRVQSELNLEIDPAPIDFNVITEEIKSMLIAQKNLTSDESRKNWIVNYFSTKLNKEVTVKELWTDSQYDLDWFNLLQELINEI